MRKSRYVQVLLCAVFLASLLAISASASAAYYYTDEYFTEHFGHTKTVVQQADYGQMVYYDSDAFYNTYGHSPRAPLEATELAQEPKKDSKPAQKIQRFVVNLEEPLNATPKSLSNNDELIGSDLSNIPKASAGEELNGAGKQGVVIVNVPEPTGDQVSQGAQEGNAQAAASNPQTADDGGGGDERNEVVPPPGPAAVAGDEGIKVSVLIILSFVTIVLFFALMRKEGPSKKVRISSGNGLIGDSSKKILPIAKSKKSVAKSKKAMSTFSTTLVLFLFLNSVLLAAPVLSSNVTNGPGDTPTTQDTNNDSPLADAPADTPPADTPADAPPADTPGDAPPEDTTGDAPPEDTSGDVPPEDTTEDVPPEDTTEDVPPEDTTGDVPPEDTTGDVPPEDTTGDVPPENTTEDTLPENTTEDVPLENTTEETSEESTYIDPKITVSQTASVPSQGGVAVFEITVMNDGGTNLSDVMLVNFLPAGMVYVSASPSPDNVTNGGRDVAWGLGPMDVGDSTSLTLRAELNYTPSGCEELTNSLSGTGYYTNGSVTDHGSTDFDVCEAEITAVKIDQTSQVASQGGQVIFNLTVTNTGNVTLQNVRVTDSLPAGLAYVSASTSPTSLSPLYWDLGSLGSGASRSITLTTEVNYIPNGCDTLSNSISASGAPPNGDNVTDTDTETVTVCKADITAIKIDQTSQVASQGGQVIFNLTVTNTGNVTLQNIRLTDSLPSGLAYVSASTAPTSMSPLYWDIGTLSSGASRSITLTTEVNYTPDDCDTLSNSISASGAPPNGDNVTDNDSRSITVCEAGISAVKIDQTSQVASQGGRVIFNLTVTNTGNVTLQSVRLTDSLPDGLTYVSASTAPTSMSPLYWDLGSLASGASRSITLTTRVNYVPYQCENLSNSISVTGAPPNGDNVTDTDTETVTVCEAEMAAIKIDQTLYTASQGGIVDLEIVVLNVGNVTLQNVRLSDVLPAGLTYVPGSATRVPNSVSPLTWNEIGPIAKDDFTVIRFSAEVNYVPDECDTLVNRISAVGRPLNGDNVSEDDDLNITVCEANVSAVKVDQTAHVASQGGRVTYNITVTNSGSARLRNVTVKDGLPAGLDYVSSTLAPESLSPLSWKFGPLEIGESMTIILETEVNYVPNSCDTLTNSIDVDAEPYNGDNVTNQDTSVVTVCKADVQAIKVDQTVYKASQGGLLTFNITVRNSGNVTLPIVTLVDTLPANISYVSASTVPDSLGPATWDNLGPLSPGQSVNITLVARVAYTPVECEDVTNVVDVEAQPYNGDNVTSSDSVDVEICEADVSTIKVDQTVHKASQGGVVTFDIEVENTGNVTLQSVRVQDDLPAGLTYSGASTAPDSTSPVVWDDIGPLSPGETRHITINGTVNFIPNECEDLINLVSVDGEPYNGDNVTSSDSVSVEVCEADVAVFKLDQTVYMASQGGIITYEITIRNTGNVTLDPISVDDYLPSGLTYLSASEGYDIMAIGANGTHYIWNNVSSLEPGERVTLTLNATVDPFASNCSFLTNSVNVTAHPLNGVSVSDTDSEVVEVCRAEVSGIKIDQTAQMASQGGVLNFQAVIQNTGFVPLRNVEITDALDSNLGFLSSTLTPDSLSPLTWNVGPLAPGATAVINYSATVDYTPVECDLIGNTINVDGEPYNGDNVTDSDTIFVDVCEADVSALKIDQTAQIASQGGILDFMITVANTGNVTLGTIVVNDTLPANITFLSSNTVPDSSGQTTVWTIGPLASGASQNITLRARVGYTPNECEWVTNLVGARGVPYNGDDVTSSDSVSVEVCEADVTTIKVDQTMNTASQNGIVTYGLTVTNTGNVTLVAVTLTDTLPAGLTYSGASIAPDRINGQSLVWMGLAPLAPGASVNIALNATVNYFPDTCDDIMNVLDVEGQPANGDNVTSQDTLTVTVCRASVQTIKVDQTSAIVSQGGLLTFNISVQNTGNVTLPIVTLVDTLPANVSFVSATIGPDFLSPVTWNNLGPLDPGESVDMTLVARVDYTPNGCEVGTNVVDVEAQPYNGDNVTGRDSVAFQVCEADISALKIDQTAFEASQGGILTFDLVVTNTGNVTLDLVTLTDTLPADLDFLSTDTPALSTGAISVWSIGPLAPGQTATVQLNATASHNLPSGCEQVINSITVEGQPPNGDNVTGQDTLSIMLCWAGVNAIKADQTLYEASQGGTVTFRLSVTNTGNVTLGSVNLTDTLPTGLSYLGTDTPATLTGQTTVWQLGQLNAGETVNILLNASVDIVPVGCQDLFNNMDVVAQPFNGDIVNDSDSLGVRVCEANISAVKLDVSTMPAVPGGQVNFLINVTNSGFANLSEVFVTDDLPAGMQYLSSSPLPDFVSGDNRTVTWALGPLDVGDWAAIYLNASIDANVQSNLTNRVTVIGVPYNGDNVTDTDNITIGVNFPAIDVLKTVDDSSIREDENAVFTIRLTNTGVINLSSITLTDDLPNGLVFVSASLAPNATAPSLFWNNIPDLGAGESYEIDVIVKGVEPGVYVNTADANAVPLVGQNVSDSDSVQLTVTEGGNNGGNNGGPHSGVGRNLITRVVVSPVPQEIEPPEFSVCACRQDSVRISAMEFADGKVNIEVTKLDDCSAEYVMLITGEGFTGEEEFELSEQGQTIRFTLDDTGSWPELKARIYCKAVYEAGASGGYIDIETLIRPPPAVADGEPAIVTPTGAVVAGELDLFWIIAAAQSLLILFLLFALLRKRRMREEAAMPA